MATVVRVLGAIALHHHDSTLDVRGLLKRRLLARLAIRPDEIVSVDGLCDALWGNDPPATARQSLHVHISHLRRAARDAGIPDPIHTTDTGYRLAAEYTVDAWEFEALVQRGLDAAGRGDRREALALLGDARAMWDEPFPDLADDLSVVTEQIRLVTLSGDLVDRLHELAIELDDPDVVRSLQATVAEQPLRDAPYGQLMRVHAAREEHAKALSVYDDVCRIFYAELGIAPSADLTALADAMREKRTLGPTEDVAATTLRRLLDEGTRLVLVDERNLGDVATRLDLLNADLRRDGIRSKRVAVPPTAFDPLGPLVDVQRIGPPVGAQPYRQSLFSDMADRLEQECGSHGVVMIEGFDRASTPMIDFITYVLERDRGDFRFLALSAGDLSARFDHVVLLAGGVSEIDAEAETRPVDRLTDAELTLMGALEACILPTPAEPVLRGSGLARAAAVDALSRLTARGIVDHEIGGRLSIRRRHPNARRPSTDFHRSMVTAVRGGDAGGPYGLVAELHHRLAAGEALSSAGTAAAAAGALDRLEALGAYREIVELLGGADPDLETTAGLAIQVRVGRAQIRAGEIEDGRSALLAAIDAADDHGEAELLAEAVRALREERAPQTTDEAERTLLERALTGLGDVVSETRIQLMTDLANSYFMTAPNEAITRSLETLDLARRAGDDRSVARALTGLAQSEMVPGRAARRLELALEAQELARRSDLTETLVLALTYEAAALIEMGQLRRAEPPLHYAVALAADVQVPRYKWWAATWTALLTLATDGAEKAEDRFREAYEIWPSVYRPDALDCYMTQLANLHLLRGTGGELADALLEIAVRSGSGRGAAALAFAQGGDADRARSLLAELFEPGVISGVHNIARAPLISAAAEAALLCGSVEGAAILRAAAEPLADTHIVLNTWGGGGYYWGSMRHTLAVIDELAGDVQAALEGYRRAAREQAEAGGLTFAARAEDAAGRLARDLG